MSNNEEHSEASRGDAQSGSVAPAPERKKSATTTPPSPPHSRFYSRLSRGVSSPAKPVAAEESTSILAEGLTAEEAVKLKDNLPVRANYDGPIDESREHGSGDRERRSRSDFGDERPGRRERGRGRGRDRDRDRKHSRSREPEAEASAPDGAGETPASSETENAESRVRFEDAHEHDAVSTVQEFRPSRDREFVADAGRAEKRREERAAPATEPKSKSGLFGWMKSMFTGETEEATVETPTDDRGPGRRSRGPRRDRDSRSSGKSGQHAGPKSQGGNQDGDGRRRRRRRGGRNRRRPGGGEGRSGAPSNAHN